MLWLKRLLVSAPNCDEAGDRWTTIEFKHRGGLARHKMGLIADGLKTTRKE
jgi:hypothetical protein